MFRVGRADERLASAGSTTWSSTSRSTLSAPPARFAFNAATSTRSRPSSTCRRWRGGRRVPGGLCPNLHALPLDRLDVEQKILRSEASQHTPTGPIPSMVRWSTARGPWTDVLRGVRSPPTWSGGRHCLGGRELHRGNAALWLSGPPPSGLTLNLPSGARRATPVASSALDGSPSWYAEGPAPPRC